MYSRNQTGDRSAKPVAADSDDTVLRTEKVNVYYGDTLAVQEVSMDILKNSVTAFIGPSGCGKSTLIRCLVVLTIC